MLGIAWELETKRSSEKWGVTVGRLQCAEKYTSDLYPMGKIKQHDEGCASKRSSVMTIL